MVLADHKINCLSVENKSGRTNYHVRSVVDTTGDCDIAKFAGVPTETFKQGNMPAAWYYYANENGYHLRQVGILDERVGDADDFMTKRRFTGLDAKEISELVCLSHQTTLNNWLQKREHDEKSVIATIATIPQVRMTRKIVGEYELSHMEEHTFFEDSIGLVSDWK